MDIYFQAIFHILRFVRSSNQRLCVRLVSYSNSEHGDEDSPGSN